MTDELGANGPDVVACLREAVERLTAPSPRNRGQFTIDNTDRAVTYFRSEAFWTAIAPARDLLVARVATDLALTPDAAPETLLRLVQAYAEASLFRESMWIRLVECGGPITAKGKQRGALRCVSRGARSGGSDRRPR